MEACPISLNFIITNKCIITKIYTNMYFSFQCPISSSVCHPLLTSSSFIHKNCVKL